MNHTATPWKIARRGLDIELHNDNDAIAYMRTTHLAEDDANLRLIAAAPDLLAALCELVGIAEFDLLDDKSNVWRSALINANAAIAKATGGEQ